MKIARDAANVKQILFQISQAEKQILYALITQYGFITICHALRFAIRVAMQVADDAYKSIDLSEKLDMKHRFSLDCTPEERKQLEYVAKKFEPITKNQLSRALRLALRLAATSDLPDAEKRLIFYETGQLCSTKLKYTMAKKLLGS